jgi:hypothetical protein
MEVMKRLKVLMVLFVPIILLTSACGGPSIQSPTQAPATITKPTESISPTQIESTPTSGIQPASEPRQYSLPTGGTLPTAKNDYFTAAGNCVVCHRSNFDEADNDVSFDKDWRGSMMAQAAIDPYYLAGVSMNLSLFPTYDQAIQSKCSSCHMPMAHTSAAFTGEKIQIFGDDGFLHPDNTLNILARDGVSCTACHQIQDQNLGEFTSFSGGFQIDAVTPTGERLLYGSYIPHMGSQRMMAMATGFISQPSDHLLESEICATCHNLYTQYITEDGVLSEDYFPEQTPYTEWLYSDYATQATCQDCHLPPAEGSVVLSNLGHSPPRSPFGIHTFTGGNAYMLNLLKNYGGEIGVQSGIEHLDEAIQRTLTQLERETAELSLSSLQVEGSTLSFDVSTRVLTGHKFPTGYPSRRVWLHIIVKDSEGEIIFESGGVGEDGAIQGNENDQLDQAFEPHYDLITTPDQVQIYETILIDPEENLTTVLLAASAYQKDNRLLPSGFQKNTAPEDIKPWGAAFEDENFTAGGDIVRYQIDLGEAVGPFTVEAELFYQSISYRWAMDLRNYDTRQIQIFSEYYDGTPNLPVLIASQIRTSE